MKNKNTVNGT